MPVKQFPLLCVTRLFPSPDSATLQHKAGRNIPSLCLNGRRIGVRPILLRQPGPFPIHVGFPPPRHVPLHPEFAFFNHFAVSCVSGASSIRKVYNTPREVRILVVLHSLCPSALDKFLRISAVIKLTLRRVYFSAIL